MKGAPTLGSGTGIPYREVIFRFSYLYLSDHFWLYRGTMGVEAYHGKGSNGGVWEWTSTTFDNHEGLVPTQFFTGYSTDFFDTKHQVVVSLLFTLDSSSYIRDFLPYSSVRLMQPFLILLVVAQSATSISTITLIPGLELELCMIFEDLSEPTIQSWNILKLCTALSTKQETENLP